MDFTSLWLLASTLMFLQQYQASTFPVATAEDGAVGRLVHQPHRREKRCSCENQKDKECIFFCHIGIVWVNTPSHVVPYGFGSVRLRRELGRCACTDSRDSECVSFCSVHTLTREENTPVKRDSAAWLLRHRAALWEKRSRHALERQT